MPTNNGPSVTDDEIGAAFREAWLECMDKHDGTLVSGPCDECCIKHAARLRASRKGRYASGGQT